MSKRQGEASNAVSQKLQEETVESSRDVEIPSEEAPKTPAKRVQKQQSTLGVSPSGCWQLLKERDKEDKPASVQRPFQSRRKRSTSSTGASSSQKRRKTRRDISSETSTRKTKAGRKKSTTQKPETPDDLFFSLLNPHSAEEWKKRITDFEKDMKYKELLDKDEEEIQKVIQVEPDLTVLKFCRKLMGWRPKNYPAVNDALIKCNHFELAKNVLVDKLNHTDSIEQLNTAVLIWLLVTMAQSPFDCCQIICHLVFAEPNDVGFRPFERLDFLYKIASCLKAMGKLGWKMYYRLLYALFHVRTFYEQKQHHLEDDLTPEQNTIVEHECKNGQIVRISAYAGTGKTSTLVKYAKRWRQKRFLYLCFNKSTSENAKKRFKSSCKVKVKTFHALAHEEMKKKFANKLDWKRKNLSFSTVKSITGRKDMVRVKRVTNTLDNFLQSDSEKVEPHHVPQRAREMETKTWRKYRDDASKVWEQMKNAENEDVQFSPDGYFKFWQLKKPSLDKFDCILVDEAQDLNAAFAKVVFSQNVPIILVGDPHQGINGFRGATGLPSTVGCTHNYFLTQSFRFGPEIAFTAASVLHDLKSIKNKLMVGTMRGGTVLGDSRDSVDGVTTCIIGRTNAELFSEGVLLCEDKKLIRFQGGKGTLKLDRLEDICKLYSGAIGEIKHPFIKLFKSFDQLKAYGIDAPDGDINGHIKIVETYKYDTPSRISLLKENLKQRGRKKDFLLSTAHKAKGLEFHTVRLLDDFLQQFSDQSSGQADADAALEEKINILYVAATRAKERLIMSRKLFDLIQRRGDFFCEAVANSPASEQRICVRSGCSNELSSTGGSLVVIKQHKVVVGSGNQVNHPEGILCSSCRKDVAPFYGGL